jgi:hypothetical protein
MLSFLPICVSPRGKRRKCAKKNGCAAFFAYKEAKTKLFMLENEIFSSIEAEKKRISFTFIEKPGFKCTA